MTPAAPTRPILRYHGGKWRIAPWIISHFPSHSVYVEPFGGGGSVLLRKPRSKSEIYNDLDDEVVNLFRIARWRGEELRAALELTPYARSEFDESYQPTADPLERARRLVVRSMMGFGTNCRRMNVDGTVHRTGFRASMSGRRDIAPSAEWVTYADALPSITQRLRGVVIERRDAFEIISRYDGANALFYVDPPYVPSTRSRLAGDGKALGYAHEMDEAAHVRLAGVLHAVAGAVVVSGYASPLYDELYAGWKRLEIDTRASYNKPVRECIWLRNVAPAVLL